MTAIKVTNLVKRYKDNIAVNDISFEIPYGKITALLGSNGAGKSTTLNIIAGILIPTSGKIEFAEKTLEKNYKEIKSNLGYLTSEMSLYETFTVYENLKLLGGLKGFSRHKIKQRIEELSVQFELEAVLDKYYAELSSGQKQRSLIAASVIHDPEILIFDEITASLDIVISKHIMDFIKAEKDRGKAIIFSTHILSEVEYLSDRILIIEHGEIIKRTGHLELINSSGCNNLTEAFYNTIVQEKKTA